MTSGGNNFDYFPDNQLTKCKCSLNNNGKWEYGETQLPPKKFSTHLGGCTCTRCTAPPCLRHCQAGTSTSTEDYTQSVLHFL